MDHFKVFIEFVTILLLLFVLSFWDLSSQRHMWSLLPCTPCIERWSLNHWTPREVPLASFEKIFASLCSNPLPSLYWYWNWSSEQFAWGPKFPGDGSGLEPLFSSSSSAPPAAQMHRSKWCCMGSSGVCGWQGRKRQPPALSSAKV